MVGSSPSECYNAGMSIQPGTPSSTVFDPSINLLLYQVTTPSLFGYEPLGKWIPLVCLTRILLSPVVSSNILLFSLSPNRTEQTWVPVLPRRTAKGRESTRRTPWVVWKTVDILLIKVLFCWCSSMFRYIFGFGKFLEVPTASFEGTRSGSVMVSAEGFKSTRTPFGGICYSFWEVSTTCSGDTSNKFCWYA